MSLLYFLLLCRDFFISRCIVGNTLFALLFLPFLFYVVIFIFHLRGKIFEFYNIDFSEKYGFLKSVIIK